MYENETYEIILERMLNRVSDKLDKRPSSIIYDTHSATAIELQALYIELEYLIKNSYGDTAAREFLIMLAKDRGLAPDTATRAVLEGEFTPVSIDVIGKHFNIGDMNYTVLEEMAPDEVGSSYTPDKKYYKVQCESTGEIGNQYLGQMIPVDYIPKLETANLTKVLIPGEDDEDTEVFRQRYFDSFNERAFGGNRAAYIETVKKIDGVGDVKVTRAWNGGIRPAEMLPTEKVTTWYNSVIDELDAEVAAWLSSIYAASCEKKLTVGGTVLVTVVNSMDFGEASEVLLNKIQTELDPVESIGEGDGLVPIGHMVNVKSADPVQLYVTTNVTFNDGYSWGNTNTLIQDAVDAYLLELRKEWAGSSNIVVRISQIEKRVLGVNGILDVDDTKINGLAGNLTLTEYQIPVLGGVST